MQVIRDILSAEIHLRLDETDFDKLTSGEMIRFDGDGLPGVNIKMILADIGYDQMIKMLESKRAQMRGV